MRGEVCLTESIKLSWGQRKHRKRQRGVVNSMSEIARGPASHQKERDICAEPTGDIVCESLHDQVVSEITIDGPSFRL